MLLAVAQKSADTETGMKYEVGLRAVPEELVARLGLHPKAP